MPSTLLNIRGYEGDVVTGQLCAGVRRRAGRRDLAQAERIVVPAHEDPYTCNKPG
jgi:hypothetical protein